MKNFINYLHLEYINSGRVAVTPAWNNVNYNSDNFARIHLIEEGAGAMMVNGTWYNLLPGKLHVVPDAAGHEYVCYGHLVSHWIYFRAKLPGGINLLNLLNFPIEYSVEEPESYFNLFKEITTLREDKSLAAAFRQWTILLTLLKPFMENVDDSSQQQLANYQRFLPLLELVENNLKAPPTLAQMAEVVKLSPSYLSGTFKKQFGLTIRQYINNLRIQQTKELLIHTDFTLDHIADKVGFYDAYHLSKTFSKNTGQTPGKFRKEMPELRSMM